MTGRTRPHERRSDEAIRNRATSCHEKKRQTRYVLRKRTDSPHTCFLGQSAGATCSTWTSNGILSEQIRQTSFVLAARSVFLGSVSMSCRL